MNPRRRGRYALTIASGIGTVVLTYLLVATFAATDSIPKDTLEEPALQGVSTSAYLRAAPPPSNGSYDGIGDPTVVVTHTSKNGGLDTVLHFARVWSTDPGGFDACGRAELFIDDFRVFEPAGGASASDARVTYTSDSYDQPTSNTPGGDKCATRVSPGKTWHLEVCWEFDGVLSPPRPEPDGTRFDDWDGCMESTSTPSSMLGVVLGL